MFSNSKFWFGKSVLITGHTGFKGSWLTLLLHHMGAKVMGISLPPSASTNLFTLARIDSLCQSHACDIRDAEKLTSIINATNPEIVLHLAAQPLVRTSYSQPLETFSTNIMGTVNILESLRHLKGIRAAVMVTTDKVYRHRGQHIPYCEDDALGGHDPYSASKAACEIVVESYQKSFLAERGVAIATARAGNVIGGGDWSEDRLIPDAIRAWQCNQTLHIRRPNAIRPWQHVLEPLVGYLILAEKLWNDIQYSGAYNFGPYTRENTTVRDVIMMAQNAYGKGAVQFGDGSEGPHESGWLGLEITKARTQLGIEPRWSLEKAIHKTMYWYGAQRDGIKARDLCLADIHAYEADA